MERETRTGISPDGDGLQNLSRALELLRAEVPQIFAALSRHVRIEELIARSGTLAEVTIDRVIVGDASVEAVHIADAAVQLHSGNVFLQNVQMVLRLELSLFWSIDLGWIFSASGSQDLPPIEFGMNVGNVLVPDLADIELEISAATSQEATLSVPPLAHLDLGAANFDELRVEGIQLPTRGFVLSGMGLGTVTLAGLEVPEADTVLASIRRFAPDAPFVLPQAAVNGVSLPATSVDDIQSGDFDIEAQASRRTIGLDLGVLEFGVRVRPIVMMHVGSMRMQDVELGADVGSILIENLRVPVEAEGISLQNPRIRDISVNNVVI